MNLKEKGISDILVFGGGTIPENDRGELKSLGIGKIFSTGTKGSSLDLR